MLILVTGVPGSGKTLYAVGLIKQYLSEGRSVYADIDGLVLPGVLPAPDDWRDCPDGSVVVYDECQQRFGPDGAGRSGREDIQDLEIHRHRGFDIILITQHPKLLHAHIRRLIGRHHHIFRMYGSQTAKVFTRDGQIDIDKSSQLRDQDSVMWSYPVSDFALYKSATVHTHKRQLPAWLKRSVVGLLVVGALSGVLMVKSGAFFRGEFSRSSPAPVARERAAASPVLPAQVSSVGEVSGCISSSRACRCFDRTGRPMVEVSDQQCRLYVVDPLYQPVRLRSQPDRG